MAFDRPDDGNGPEFTRPELHLRSDRPAADAAGARPEPAEPRTHEEYYDALRAADGNSPADGTDADNGPTDDGRTADSRTANSGWSSVDASDRPPADEIQVSPERRVHILDGDSTGGGHRHGVGKPGKTEFPASWNDEKIIASVLEVARRPDKPPTRQDWNDTWLCTGTRDRVDVSAVVERSGNILTGWPEEGGPGVIRNPRKGKS